MKNFILMLLISIGFGASKESITQSGAAAAVQLTKLKQFTDGDRIFKVEKSFDTYTLSETKISKTGKCITSTTIRTIQFQNQKSKCCTLELCTDKDGEAWIHLKEEDIKIKMEELIQQVFDIDKNSWRLTSPKPKFSSTTDSYSFKVTFNSDIDWIVRVSPKSRSFTLSS